MIMFENILDDRFQGFINYLIFLVGRSVRDTIGLRDVQFTFYILHFTFYISHFTFYILLNWQIWTDLHTTYILTLTFDIVDIWHFWHFVLLTFDIVDIWHCWHLVLLTFDIPRYLTRSQEIWRDHTRWMFENI